MQKLIEHYYLPLLTAGVLLIAILSGSIFYQNKALNSLEEANRVLLSELESTKTILTQREADIARYEANLEEIRQAFARSEENGSELFRLLTEEKNKNDVFEEQIEDITGTVGQLDKLSKIDPELLMKYSKVSFLNEHYAPEKVTEIASMFRFKTDEPEYIHSKISRRLNNLLEDAQEDSISLLVVSGYRSFDEQKSLKSAYS
ncbi:MAG: D-alanyl-D-alanine carboxypeptidase family protein, partial [Candidatus Magasanikiibacteriota bacterium]